MPDVHFSNQYPYTDFHELNLDWVIETVKHWADLVGKTIQSITLTGSSDLVDTYTINYSDGTTSTFTVTNGRGITSIVLTGSLDLVDTYTITYNDGTTSTFQIHNGNGISSIEKTGTSGLIDTYTITFTDGSSTTFEVKNGAEALDATLSLAGYAADAKATGDALDLKQNKDEPIALAENLTPYSPDSGVSQNQPFILQGTGTGNGENVIDTGSYAQLKKKLGNSVSVNQQWDESKIPFDSALYSSNTYTANGVTFTKNGDGSITIQTDNGGATALTEVKIATAATIPLTQKHLIRGAFGGSDSTYHINYAGGARKATDGSIFEPYTYGFNMWISVESGAVITTPKKIYPQIIFLPLWFGSEGNIPSYLLSHPEDFGRYYSGSLAANPGQIDNADGSVLTIIRRNCFGGTVHIGKRWQNGSYVDAGNAFAATDDLTAVSPNTEYAFALPQKAATTAVYIQEFDASGTWIKGASALSIASAGYVTYTVGANTHFVAMYYYHAADFVASEVSEVDISRYYSGESGYGQHYPYTVLAQIDAGSEVLRSTGAVADEMTADGTITRHVGVIDLGTLTWTYENGVFYTTGTSAIAKPQHYPICARYVAIDDGSDKSIYIGNSGITYVYDSSYTNAAAFQAAMNGVEMNYELITPTTEQGTAFPANVDIDDFGSMNWNVTNGIPQGIEIFYPVDYKAAIDTLLNMVNGDVGKIVTTDTYPDVPAADGTYVLKVTVSGGTVTRSWVLE